MRSTFHAVVLFIAFQILRLVDKTKVWLQKIFPVALLVFLNFSLSRIMENSSVFDTISNTFFSQHAQLFF